MTKRIYNYKTNKLYESTGVYIVNIHEEDDNGNVNDYEFEDRFSSVAEAQSAINDAIERISDKYCDVCDCEVIEDGNTTTINTCDKTFVFEIVDDMNEVPTVSRPAPRYVNDGKSMIELDDVDDETTYESVSSRFAKLRTLFEDENSDDGGDDNAEDNTEDNADDNTDDTNDDNADDKSDDEGGEDDEEMKAVVLTVKKGDEEDCKKEMIDAGISEDDIEILDADEDADEVEIRVDVNSVMELKDYLDKKGINLEDEIGGEIVSDDDGDSEDKSGEDGDSEDGGEGGDDDFNFDDFGDMFGGDGEGEDENK